MADKLVKQRVGHRAYFSKLHAAIFSKLSSLNNVNLPTFLAELSLLQERYNLIERLNAEILDSLIEDEDISGEIEKSGSVMHELLLKLTEVKNEIQKISDFNAHKVTSASGFLSQSAKLPKLSLL